MDDATRWDAKYRGSTGAARSAPDPFVLDALGRVEAAGGRGSALDLAAGTGRHALELARRGWEVSAWDVSAVGLEILERRAAEAGVAVDTRVVDLLRADDLLRSSAAVRTFDLVVCVLFLDRRLMARLSDFVSRGGFLVFTTVTVDAPGDKPPARFRLERGELARGIAGFETLHDVEADGRAGILARRARRAAT